MAECSDDRTSLSNEDPEGPLLEDASYTADARTVTTTTTVHRHSQSLDNNDLTSPDDDEKANKLKMRRVHGLVDETLPSSPSIEYEGDSWV